MITVLLVEDNEMLREMMEERLEARDFAVISAEDGIQAVKLAASERPDVILMDMSIPLLNGWDATREIKSTPEIAYIPVIALTAHVIEGEREKALQAGCDDYIPKPVDFPALVAKIHKYAS